MAVKITSEGHLYEDGVFITDLTQISGPSSADDVPEGTTNTYYTDEKVRSFIESDVINDSGQSTTEVWSSQKVSDEVASAGGTDPYAPKVFAGNLVLINEQDNVPIIADQYTFEDQNGVGDALWDDFAIFMDNGFISGSVFRIEITGQSQFSNRNTQVFVTNLNANKVDSVLAIDFNDPRYQHPVSGIDEDGKIYIVAPKDMVPTTLGIKIEHYDNPTPPAAR